MQLTNERLENYAWLANLSLSAITSKLEKIEKDWEAFTAEKAKTPPDSIFQNLVIKALFAPLPRPRQQREESITCRVLLEVVKDFHPWLCEKLDQIAKGKFIALEDGDEIPGYRICWATIDGKIHVFLDENDALAKAKVNFLNLLNGQSSRVYGRCEAASCGKIFRRPRKSSRVCENEKCRKELKVQDELLRRKKDPNQYKKYMRELLKDHRKGKKRRTMRSKKGKS